MMIVASFHHFSFFESHMLLTVLSRNMLTPAQCNPKMNNHHPAHTQTALKRKTPWMKIFMLNHAH